MATPRQGSVQSSEVSVRDFFEFNLRPAAFSLSLLVLVAIQSCRSSATDPLFSKVSYGSLGDETPEVMALRLINVPPKSKIWVCLKDKPIQLGTKPATDVVAMAVRLWAFQLGRISLDSKSNDKLVIEQADDPTKTCEFLKTSGLIGANDGVVQIEDADGTCEGTVSGYTSNPDKDHPYPYRFGKPVSFCTAGGFDEEILKVTAIHEIGHLWGLCDQYETSPFGDRLTSSIGFHSNCDPKIRSEQAERSVMNSAGYGLSISDDDKLGIRVLACITPDAGWMAKKELIRDYQRDHYQHTIDLSKEEPESYFISELERLQKLGVAINMQCLEKQ